MRTWPRPELGRGHVAPRLPSSPRRRCLRRLRPWLRWWYAACDFRHVVGQAVKARRNSVADTAVIVEPHRVIGDRCSDTRRPLPI